jgi:glycosyltransferase involved in cell wall biosynthesis
MQHPEFREKMKIMTRVCQPLVSIVTPVYNGGEYLSECIESILAQTYQNWDYTIVNNCSTDQTMEIARWYAARDTRIRIYDNKQFLEVIASHNTALLQISPASKYCKLVFADDWIFPECIERMVAVAEEFPSVGLVGAYVLQGQEVKCTGLPYKTRMFDGREICRRHFLNRLYVFESANAVLYRADLVRDKAVFYNENNIHADTEVCFALLKTNDFGFVHQILTYTRVRSESLSAFSADFHTYFAGMLQLLLLHGPGYLTKNELDSLIQHHISGYYSFLGKCLMLGQGKILNYHKRKLVEAGIGFHWSRVVLGMLSTGWSLALNPYSTAKKLWKTLGKPSLSGHKQNELSAAIAAEAMDNERRN